MDLSRPIASVVPTLDGPVLQVLAGTTAPLSGRRIHGLARTGSEAGVRRVLNRLAQHGLVTVTHAGAADLYVANRDHLAWPAVERLAMLRPLLLDLMRKYCASLVLHPVHVSLFGSVARGEGDTSSDIDVLLVRPEAAAGSASDDEAWEDQWVTFRSLIHSATGNPCSIFEVSQSEFHEIVRTGGSLAAEWARDTIDICGKPFAELAGNARKAVRG